MRQALINPLPPVRAQLAGMPGGKAPENSTVPEAIARFDGLLLATNAAHVSRTPGAPFRGRQMSTVVVGVGLTATVTGFDATVTGTTKLSVTRSSKDQVPVVVRARVEVDGLSPALQLNELPRLL
jgi:hypothetical protein